jgi:hypothetical protein
MVEINEAALQRVAEEVAKQVEVELNKVLAQAHQEMARRPVEEIRPVLEQRIAAALPQYHPSSSDLDKFAAKVAGT